MPALLAGIHAVDGRDKPGHDEPARRVSLALLFEQDHAVLDAFSPSAAWAAASRAIGTRNGEQDT